MMLLPKKFGPVTLMRKLSSDGVAETFAGILDEPAGKMVIVRRLMPYVTRDAAMLASVEARIQDLSAVRHLALVPTLEYLVIDDERLIIEDRIDSIGLDDVLAWCRDEGTAVPQNVYLHMATQICNGLEALHGRPGAASAAEHVLHLALRPSVVRLTREGTLLVGDYGLIRSPTSLPHGGAGPVPTLMEYLSPEQTHPDRELTPASDIFALGSVLYEFLTLEPLFKAQSNLQTIHRVRKAEVTPHLLRVKEILPGLDKVLYRALSLNPRHRYQRAFVLREDLRGLMAGFTFSNITEDTVAFLAPLFARTGGDDPEAFDPLDENTASLLARAVGDPGPAEPGPVRLEPAASVPEFDPPPRPDTLVPDNLDGLDEDAMFPERDHDSESTLPGAAMPTFYDEGDEGDGVPTSIDDEGAPTTIDESDAPPLPGPGPVEEEHTSWHRRATLTPEEAPDSPSVAVADAEETQPGELAEGVPRAGQAGATLSPESAAARPAPEPAPEPVWDDDDRPTDVKPDPSAIPAKPHDLAPEAEAPPGPAVDDDWDDLDYKPSGGMGKWLLIGAGAVVLLALVGVCAGVGAGGLGLGFLSSGEEEGGAPEVVSSLSVEEPAEPMAPPTEPATPDGPEEDTPVEASPPTAKAPEPPPRTTPSTTTPRTTPATATPPRSTPPRTSPSTTARATPPRDPTPAPEPDDFVDSIDLTDEPKGTLEVADLEPPPTPDDDIDIVTSFDEVRSELDVYTDRAYRGALTQADKSALGAVRTTDPDYTKAMVILYQDAKAKGDVGARQEYVAAVMTLPENQYNPNLLCEKATLALESKAYGEALDAANLAERHWARLPSEHIFVRKALIYEVQAIAHQNLFYQSEGDDLDELHAAIHSWEKYQRHANTKSRVDMANKADEQLAKLHDIQRRLR